MTGPLHRFRALHRYWLVLLAGCFILGWQATAYKLSGADRALVVTIFVLLLWIPLTASMVFIPRVRGFVLTVGFFTALFQFIDPDGLFGPSAIPVSIVFFTVLFFAASRIVVPVRLRASLIVERPVSEIADIIRMRETETYWHTMYDRIEPHPEDPDGWRCFTAHPFNKAAAYFDTFLLSTDANGGYTARIEMQVGKRTIEANVSRKLTQAGTGTRIEIAEDARVSIMAALMFWFDRIALDHLYQLKFHAEGMTDWSLIAGAGRWWPTWRPAHPSSAF